MTGRRLLITELKGSETEVLISIAAWAVRKFKQYTLNATKIQVVLPWKEQVALVKDLDVHIRLRAKLLDLALYNVTWTCGANVWW